MAKLHINLDTTDESFSLHNNDTVAKFPIFGLLTIYCFSLHNNDTVAK
ncbi:MAG: hypothetical protein ACRCVI_01050 [Mycoplasmoidaceae bacterium]